MPNILKKVTKHCGDTLAVDESFKAATFVQPAGSVGKQVAMGAIGGVAGALVAGKVGAKRQAEAGGATGVAATLPTERCHVALTERRVLFFKHGAMSGNPKELIAETTLADLDSVEFDKGKLSHLMTLTFSDGSTTAYDVMRGSQGEEFVEAFHLLKGRAAPAL